MNMLGLWGISPLCMVLVVIGVICIGTAWYLKKKQE